VKRFLIVLVLLAGGLTWAALGVPSNAATVNGTGISQSQLDSNLSAIARSPDYQCYLAAQEFKDTNGQDLPPPLAGAGQTQTSGSHSLVTTAYASQYLNDQIGNQVLFNLAAERGLHATSKELGTARKDLTAQVEATMKVAAQYQGDISACPPGLTLTGKAVLASMPASFVDETARYDATGVLLVDHALPTTTANETTYYDAHRSDFDTVCFTVAEYSSASDAATGYQAVTAGTPFAQVAAAAATGSGPQGCQDLYGIAYELSSVTNLLTLKTGVVTQPLAISGDYLLLQITSRAPASFASVQTAVQAAVAQEANQMVQKSLVQDDAHAQVSVNPRYGRWNPATAQIALPTTPAVRDVLNAVANDPLKIVSSAAPATGTSG
jgi:hypothetical protein